MKQLGSHLKDVREILYFSIYRKSVEKVQVSYNLTRITGTVHEYLCIFNIIAWSVLLSIRNVSGKNYIQTQSTHFMFINVFAKIVPLRDNVEQYGSHR